MNVLRAKAPSRERGGVGVSACVGRSRSTCRLQGQRSPSKGVAAMTQTSQQVSTGQADRATRTVEAPDASECAGAPNPHRPVSAMFAVESDGPTRTNAYPLLLLDDDACSGASAATARPLGSPRST